MATTAENQALIHYNLHLPFEVTSEHYRLVNVVALRFWEYLEPHTFREFIERVRAKQHIQLSEQEQNLVFITIKRLQKQPEQHIPTYKDLYLFADTLLKQDTQKQEASIANFIQQSANQSTRRSAILTASSTHPIPLQQS